jgi:hypothetical protein
LACRSCRPVRAAHAQATRWSRPYCASTDFFFSSSTTDSQWEKDFRPQLDSPARPPQDRARDFFLSSDPAAYASATISWGLGRIGRRSPTRLPLLDSEGKVRLDAANHKVRGGANVRSPERNAVLKFIKSLHRRFNSEGKFHLLPESTKSQMAKLLVASFPKAQFTFAAAEAQLLASSTNHHAYMNRVAKKQSTVANGSFSSKQSSQAGSDDDEPFDEAEADGTASADAAEEDKASMEMDVDEDLTAMSHEMLQSLVRQLRRQPRKNASGLPRSPSSALSASPASSSPASSSPASSGGSPAARSPASSPPLGSARKSSSPSLAVQGPVANKPASQALTLPKIPADGSAPVSSSAAGSAPVSSSAAGSAAAGGLSLAPVKPHAQSPTSKTSAAKTKSEPTSKALTSIKISAAGSALVSSSSSAADSAAAVGLSLAPAKPHVQSRTVRTPAANQTKTEPTSEAPTSTKISAAGSLAASSSSTGSAVKPRARSPTLQGPAAKKLKSESISEAPTSTKKMDKPQATSCSTTKTRRSRRHQGSSGRRNSTDELNPLDFASDTEEDTPVA